jgi:hypothetical protein
VAHTTATVCTVRARGRYESIFRELSITDGKQKMELVKLMAERRHSPRLQQVATEQHVATQHSKARRNTVELVKLATERFHCHWLLRASRMLRLICQA